MRRAPKSGERPSGDHPAATDAVRAHAPHEFKRAIISGLAWKGTSQVTTQLTRFAVTIVLARLLTPHDYGIAGMVLVFGSFVLIFSDFALGPTLIQRARLTHLDTSTAFWASVASGTLFTIISLAVAGPISSFFGESVLRPMIMVLGMTFFIQAVGLTQSALLIREMQFRSLEVRQIAAAVGGGAVGVGTAAAGYGAWAIIWQQVAAAIVSTALIWHYSEWRPTREFSLATLHGFAGFTTNVFGANLAGQIRANVDNLLVGRFLGAAALGAYGLGYNLVLVPSNRIAVPLAQVLFPALSRLQHDAARLADYWKRSLQMIAAISMPCCVGLAILAPEFVDVVLGAKWHSAVPVIRLLSVVGLLQTLQFLTGTVLQALDRTGVALRWQLAKTGVCVAAFAVGLHWGVTGVAAAYAIASIGIEPLFMLAATRAIKLAPLELLRVLGGVAQASALMGCLLVALRQVTVHAGLTPLPRLALLVVAGGGAFILASYWRAPEVGKEIYRLMPRRRAAPNDAAETLTAISASAR